MKRAIVYACIGMLPTSLLAQVGIGTATPHASAQLDITATNKGLLPPRVTLANRPASPATGLLIYQTDNTPGYYFYNGSAWQSLGGSSGGGWALTGNSSVSTSFLGTTDASPLRIRVNNQPSGILSYDPYYGTILGYQAGKSNTGSHCTAFGYNALSVNTANYNVAIGHAVLQVNTSGFFNMGIGSFALMSNTTGLENAAGGHNALRYNTSGSNNTAFGGNALVMNTIGHSNVAVGKSALFLNDNANYNTAVGAGAMSSTVGGGENTAVGAEALQENVSGSYNTAIGRSALKEATGSMNTALGYNARLSDPTYSNATAIGYDAVVTGSNRVRIGDANVTQIGGAVGWTVLSDVRFKTDIQPQVHGLDFIMRLEPITYHINVRKLNSFLGTNKQEASPAGPADSKVRRKETILYSGFSAQQVEAAAAAVQYDFSGIHKPESEKDHYSLEYAEFVVPLVKAVQEQQALIEQLKKEVQELRQWKEALMKQR